ncbi:BolA family protein [Moraxella bovis]|uniref:BolA family transcriptional regulator n=1 Tax=Moraxella bovis TaxID=476 RepID=A0A1T0A3P1_MORBO|nr:BolA family protein [Moraxella bovis]AWY20946.1 BolA family transcriptional regulator [Moraxella bovis]OOR90357.1 BolA family transcriptional regulator [Moraxella bovis]UYZ69089.1 BolA family transcriptional regulator [Moraxella bovis]UYZ71462.1 BolA family transcriptional regulator [Moraxella bovis]UYZ72624.1 BolA family transcriptional regulator [Moraxella bovis]
MNTQTALTHALTALHPTHITLDNESHMHAGYFDGKESHFKLIIVSDEFVGKRLASRHQLVYGLVNPYLTTQGGTVHALAIHAYTPDELASLSSAPNSPNCAGQNK